MMKDSQSVDEVQRELLTRVRTEGVQVAYETALAICRDPKAPAPAKATAAVALFRVGGVLNQPAPVSNKEPHEMTAEELQAEIARISRRLQEKEGNPGIFA